MVEHPQLPLQFQNQRARHTVRRAVVVALLAIAVAGCATGQTPSTATVAPGDLPRTLAVLPFVPVAGKEEQSSLVTRMVYGSLSATTYDVLKLQVVEERLARAGLGDPRVAAATPPAELAKLLNVDGIVYGEVTHWDRVFLAVYAQVAAGAQIKMVDARSGQTLFERKEVSRSHQGGLPTDAVSAAIQVIQSSLKLREIEIVRASDDLVRDLLKGLPTPPVREARRPPALGNVFSDGEGRRLKTGDTVTVVAQGAPGATGAFDVVPIAKGLTLEEKAAGVYVGRYSVKPGDNATDVYVVARLTDNAGRFTDREDLLGRFVVDTMPPATPTGVSATLHDGAMLLSWTAQPEPDLAGYRVYRSRSQLTGFEAVATTEAPAYREPVDGVVYYRLAAVDRAGNESAPSASVALSVLPSALSGVVATDSYLVAAQSPYTVGGALVVDEGATLHVLPGVVVRFTPGSEGIVVRHGRLVARGTAAQPVVFESASDRPVAGDFSSALHVRARAGETSVLEHVVIRHARAGARIESGGLEIVRAQLAGNLQSGVVVAETGVLKLAESGITGHTAGGAVTVQGFGRAVLRNNRITDNGWAVVNYSGNAIDARENWWGTPTPPDELFVGDIDRRDPLRAER